jgi:Integrase zinc binding domain
LCAELWKDRVQVVVPEAIVEQVLRKVHASRVVGHWGVIRTALAVVRRYWGPK